MELNPPSLSNDESRVGSLVAAGYADPAIAKRLLLPVQAVEWNVAKLSLMLGVDSREELIAALTELRGPSGTETRRRLGRIGPSSCVP